MNVFDYFVNIKDMVERLLSLCLNAISKLKYSGNICGLGFSTFVMNLLGVDKDGNGITLSFLKINIYTTIIYQIR